MALEVIFSKCKPVVLYKSIRFYASRKTYRKVTCLILDMDGLLIGARELITYCTKNKIPSSLATSSNRKAMTLKFAKYEDLRKQFHHIVCGDDEGVLHGKPAPDIFLISAKRFGTDPKKCLVFEDSPNGIKAADAAGMQSVMVPPAEVVKDQTKLATLVLKSLEEFKPELFGLPRR